MEWFGAASCESELCLIKDKENQAATCVGVFVFVCVYANQEEFLSRSSVKKSKFFDQVEKTSYHQNTGLEERDKKCSEK